MAVEKDHVRMLLKSVERINAYIPLKYDERKQEFIVPIVYHPKTMDAVAFNLQRAVDKIAKAKPFLRKYCPADWERFARHNQTPNILTPCSRSTYNDARYLCSLRKPLHAALSAMPQEARPETATQKFATKLNKFAFQASKNASFFLDDPRETLSDDAFRIGMIKHRLDIIALCVKDLSKMDVDKEKTCDAIMHHVRLIADSTNALSPLITDRFSAFKQTELLDFREERMRESVKPIPSKVVIKAAREYAPKLGRAVDLADKEVKDALQSVVHLRSFPSFFRFQRKWEDEKSFDTKNMPLSD